MDYERVDMRNLSPEEMESSLKDNEFIFKLNHTMPMSEEYNELLNDFFGDNLGENSMIVAPIAGAALSHLKIGDNVFINSNSLLMARGGITVEDDVLMAANVQLLSNNHDEYDRQVLTCKPIHIKKGAWIGAGASILAGVTVGNMQLLVQVILLLKTFRIMR